jgi:putative phage-type endonuclease
MFKELKVNTEQEWLQLRSNVITATDMGIILGLNPYVSVAKMLEEKKTPMPLNNSYVFIGNILESVVVKATNKVLNKGFKLFEDEQGKNFFINEELKLGATPDAYDSTHILECKSTKPINYLKWHNWPPVHYLIQLYTQLICTGKEQGYLAILSTNLSQHSPELKLPIIVFLLQRTNKLDDIVLNELKRFWETIQSNKLFKVNRKQVQELELRLRFTTNKIY